MDGSKLLAHNSHIPVLCQRFRGPWRLQLFHMLMGILNGVVFHYDLRRSLLPDTWNTRNIVRRITHQRFHINKLLRSHLVPLLHIPGVVILHLCPALLRLGDPDLHMLCRKLQQISVSGYDRYLHPRFLASS